MASFGPENGSAGEQQYDINAEIAALYEANQQASQPGVQAAAPPPFDAANIAHQDQTLPMGQFFLQARGSIHMLARQIRQLNEENLHLSQVIDANNNEYARLIDIKNNELQQRDKDLLNHISIIENRLQSQGNELAHEGRQRFTLASKVEQTEQMLVARNSELSQQIRENARANHIVQQLEQRLEAQENELVRRRTEDVRQSSGQVHQLEWILAETEKNLKREQEEKLKYARAASDFHRKLQEYATRPAPLTVFGSGPSFPTNLQVPDDQVANPSYQTPIAHRNGNQALAHAQAQTGGKASSSVTTIDLTTDDNNNGPPTSTIKPNRASVTSKAGQQCQNPDPYEALQQKPLPWYEGEHPLKAMKNPGAYGIVVERASMEANGEPAPVTRRAQSGKAVSAAAERKKRVTKKKMAKATHEKAERQATQKGSTNITNFDRGGATDDQSASTKPTVTSSQDSQEEDNGLEDELDAALAQQAVSQPQCAMEPNNLEEDYGLEAEVEAALAQESVTQSESAIVPNDLEETKGLAEEFGAALDQAERQFAQELERMASAETELEEAPVADNLSLSSKQTIAKGGEQTSTTPNQHKRKMETDNDTGEGPSAKRSRPMLEHGDEEVLWGGIVDWDLGDLENQGGEGSDLEIDLDPPTRGGR